MTAFSGGPLQQSDLLAIWQSVMDDSYTEPFIQAGDGNGLEAWRQVFAQLARVSQAVDTSMQSLFILPWSGQTAAPAAGPSKATTTLALSRTGLLHQPLVLGAGLVWVDEVAPDWSPTGTQEITTGLRYTFVNDVVFEPGESGPILAEIVAERPGWGYNNPLPGTLSALEQPGTLYTNVGAAITNSLPSLPVSAQSIASAQLIVQDVPHVVIPAHVGQYFLILAGTNAGAIARAITFRAAQPVASTPDGGAVRLELLFSVHASLFTPYSSSPFELFASGELVAVVQSAVTIGYATLKDALLVGGIVKTSLVMRCGTIAPGAVLTGTQSGATATVDLVYANASTLVTTSSLPSTEQWRVLDWVQDWGITVSNAEQPTGGVAGVLDLLGRERNLPRIASEDDDAYRQRIATIADVVTPNAVMRVLNKTLTPLGIDWSFREAGSPQLPGFFFDEDAYDYDAQYFTGVAATGFVPNEPVTQTLGGVVARGKLLLKTLPPSGAPFVAGNAGATGHSAGLSVIGVSGLGYMGRQFVAGVPIVGEISGATATPTTVTGGLSDANAWRVWLDFLRMRGYFLVTVQRVGTGEFGFGWGSTVSGVGALADWWDAGPNWNDFYDGSANGAAPTYLAAYHGIDAIRAAGVYFELAPVD
jgi:hypothetical protein